MGHQTKLLWGLYGITIFLGAFLMFLIQPIIGKIVTPQYGGVAQVWCLCLLFFQLVLLGGYALTYLLSHFDLKRQSLIYIGLMAAATLTVLIVRIPLGEGWIPANPEEPIRSLLGQMMLYLAVPCVMLSTISTMMQNWFGRMRLGNPYPLYSISNIGSLGALLAYPALIEPRFPVGPSIAFWMGSYGLLALLAVILSILVFQWAKQETAAAAAAAPSTSLTGEAVQKTDFLWWVFLSTCGSVLLVSFTNHMTHNIAPIPLLWVVPLVVYLVTFILCFGRELFYCRPFYVFGSQALLMILYLAPLSRLPNHILWSLLLCLVVLFFLCMICHGELYARRPAPAKLPVFYLTVALGGAIGGILVNILAPMVFDTYLEIRLILLVMALMTLGLYAGYNLRLFYYGWLEKVYMVFLTGLIAWFVFVPLYTKEFGNVVLRARNFYSALTVLLDGDRDYLRLIHGTITHGLQRIDLKTKTLVNEPTSYYVADTAIGLANRFIRERREGQPIKIGVIGLGAGTMASFGRKGDEIVFYEIDSKMKQIAETYFSFLRNSPARMQILMGDGRTTLKHQTPQHFDILLVDAFNGDAVPVHLLTEQALELYLLHLKSDGLLVVHISNEYVNLHPVLSNLSRDLRLNCLTVARLPLKPKDLPSMYTVLSREPWFFDKVTRPDFRKQHPHVRFRSPKFYKEVGIWTDDYSNVLSVFWFLTDDRKSAIVRGS